MSDRRILSWHDTGASALPPTIAWRGACTWKQGTSKPLSRQGAVHARDILR